MVTDFFKSSIFILRNFSNGLFPRGLKTPKFFKNFTFSCFIVLSTPSKLISGPALVPLALDIHLNINTLNAIPNIPIPIPGKPISNNDIPIAALATSGAAPAGPIRPKNDANTSTPIASKNTLNIFLIIISFFSLSIFSLYSAITALILSTFLDLSASSTTPRSKCTL